MNKMKKLFAFFVIFSGIFSINSMIFAKDSTVSTQDEYEWIHKDSSNYKEAWDFFNDLIFRNYSVAGVQQRDDIGDCWLMATICSIMKTDPDYIKENVLKVTYDNDGNFKIQVNLFRPKFEPENNFNVVWEPVKVYLPLELQGSCTSAPWVQFIEMAFMKLRPTDSLNLIKNFDKGRDHISGGTMDLAYGCLTGENYMTFWFPADKEKQEFCFDLLKNGIKQKKRFSVGFSADNEIIQKNGLHSNHAYALVGYAEEDDCSYLKLINPWYGDEIKYVKWEKFCESEPVIFMDQDCAVVYYDKIVSPSKIDVLIEKNSKVI